MRKALVCAWVQMRLYIRSGRIVFALLMLIGYPLVFYHIVPVDVVSSFLMSTVAAFAWGAWIALAMNWSEEPVLRHVLMVKSGASRYHIAQALWLSLFGAAGGIFLVCLPMLGRAVYVHGMFVRDPSFREVVLGILLNACAGICGSSVGGIFHPSIIRDRKMAYLFCLLIGLLGLTAGMAGIPLAPRLLLPPLYDSLYRLGRFTELETSQALAHCIWYLLYTGACIGLRTFALIKAKES